MADVALGTMAGSIRQDFLARMDAEPQMAERVHLVRSGCKRVLAVLALGPAVPGLREAVRRIHRSLGEIRDRDIRAMLRGQPCPSEGSRKAARRWEEARAAFGALPLDRAPTMPAEAATAAHGAQLRRVAAQAERVFERPGGRRLHELRKLAKAWLHQADALQPLPERGAEASPLRAGLLTVESRLGKANDLRLVPGARKERRKARRKALRRLQALRPALQAAASVHEVARKGNGPDAGIPASEVIP